MSAVLPGVISASWPENKSASVATGASANLSFHFLPPVGFSLRSSLNRFRPFVWKWYRDNPCNKMLCPSVRTPRFAMSMPRCDHQAHNLRPVSLLEHFALLLHLAEQKG